MTNENANNKKPVAKQLHGRVHLAIWKNTSERGDYFTVTLSRPYKGKDGFRNSNSYSLADLPAIKRAVDEAENFLKAQS